MGAAGCFSLFFSVFPRFSPFFPVFPHRCHGLWLFPCSQFQLCLGLPVGGGRKSIPEFWSYLGA